ncbi:hypothetical protein COM64_20455 [Bacillus toyonensis]|uniref:FAD-dependent oxidoreductase n=1 Tax=Bacillus toyonensis TaxID=155322 RepID=UPI000B43CB38|nr:FAD-dependent oxidoreductase [Bacillus toyonensis]MEC2393467.1 FAD-dependent oxidoreductase [Bacillus toyonensis]OTX28548.1 hypothetical protein BK717_28545 [Bacillus thuringiensis serovar malayensis]PGE16328.1 hypothetical protein COM64_20455 [Bacillus toyonensis]
MTYDVIVLGGGAAGLSAALFLGDMKYNTLVIEDGRSQLKKALISNYLGMQEFEGTTLLDVGKKQLEQNDVNVVSDRVIKIIYFNNYIEIETENGKYLTNELILCCGQGPGLKLAELANVELISNDEPFAKMKIKIDEYGLTSQPRVYAAGICTGTSSQAIIAAGHGAQIALNIISAREGRRVHNHQSIPVKHS